MNFRKIQIVKTANSQVKVGNLYVLVDNSVFAFLEDRAFAVCRRPFVGAKRLMFEYCVENDIWDAGFNTNPHYYYNNIWLCREKCISILGVGKRTKKFSLWVKPV